MSLKADLRISFYLDIKIGESMSEKVFAIIPLKTTSRSAKFAKSNSDQSRAVSKFNESGEGSSSVNKAVEKFTGIEPVSKRRSRTRTTLSKGGFTYDLSMSHLPYRNKIVNYNDFEVSEMNKQAEREVKIRNARSKGFNCKCPVYAKVSA